MDRKALRVQCNSQEVLEPSHSVGLLPQKIRPLVLGSGSLLHSHFFFFISIKP